MARHFRDDTGKTWTVYAVDAAELRSGRVDLLPDDFQAGWLLFDSGKERRRLAPVPQHWSILTETELCSLLHHPRCVVVPSRDDR
jgi:hypothetical protein